jgi:hypothetical protein
VLSKVARFQPDETLRRELQRRCVDDKGSPWADVQWSDANQCLCIMRRNRAGLWREERMLRDDRNRPRNIRRHDIVEELDAASSQRNSMVTIVAHDHTLKLVPKAYAELLAKRKEQEAKHEAAMNEQYLDLAKRMEARMRGTGFGSAASWRNGARDWSRWQGVMCRHDKEAITCAECKPDRKLTFARSGRGRQGGVKGREAVN